MIDYHLHTPFCNHAVGGMEQYIQSAIDLGFREICFLDHLTIQDTEPGLSMTPGEVPYYYNAVQMLKQKYRNPIRIKAGLEIDFNPAYVNLFQDIIATYAFDVIATSLHFLGDMDIVSHRSAWRHGEKDADDVYNLYFQQFEKMLDYDYFDVICHIDLIKKFGRKPSRPVEEKIDKILSIIKRNNLTVEVNTSGYNHPVGEIYPSPDILAKCREQEISITLGSDAHHPAEIGQHYDKAFPLLLSSGYRCLATFTKRKRSEIFIGNINQERS